MSECEWGDRESCISPRPGPACGACTEWLCVRVRELEAFVRRIASIDYRGNEPWYIEEARLLAKEDDDE